MSTSFRLLLSFLTCLNSDLYSGGNAIGQKVFTWLADANTTAFTGDVFPLVDKLAASGGPDTSAYLGYFAFGTEALYSFENVTFYCPSLTMSIVT